MIRRVAAECGDLNPNQIHADGSIKESKKPTRKEVLPEIDPNIKCMQATIEWKYFDKRISLEDTLNTLIEEGYHIDLVIPTTSWTKDGSQNTLVTIALILVSK